MAKTHLGSLISCLSRSTSDDHGFIRLIPHLCAEDVCSHDGNRITTMENDLLETQDLLNEKETSSHETGRRKTIWQLLRASSSSLLNGVLLVVILLLLVDHRRQPTGSEASHELGGDITGFAPRCEHASTLLTPLPSLMLTSKQFRKRSGHWSQI